ncbi:MAG TPA: alcohol dehydrogenase catalytic domain-containing protein, partial [Bacteroidota bacterium]|nr:alcohol dehydrogenase catalytic domain-containing protein [Bacteroidota bacterium]
MKVALFEKPHALSIRQASLRAMLPNEVLLKVEACGVCGTDVHIVEGTSRSTPPVVLGHEFTGIVEDVGSGVKGVSRGQRASVDPNISCGTCFYCRRGLVHLCERLLALGVDINGGMAEYCLVPSEQLYLLPDGMRTEAAAFVEPV